MDLMNPIAIPGNPRNNFNSQLAPAQEQQFQQWATWHMPVGDLLHGGVDNGDYDMRGYWAKPLEGTSINALDEKPHYPDAYKKPWHESFSDQSQYLKYAPMMGGHPFDYQSMAKDPRHSWFFFPGAQQAMQGVMGHYY